MEADLTIRSCAVRTA